MFSNYLNDYTIRELANLLSKITTDREIHTLLLKLDRKTSCFSARKYEESDGSSKAARLEDVLKSLDEDCLRNLLKLFKQETTVFDDQNGLEVLKLLEEDGFPIEELLVEDEIIDGWSLPQKISLVKSELDKYDFKTSLYHLNQALANYEAGLPAAANSQIRSFFEAFFEELMHKIGINCSRGECRGRFIDLFYQENTDEEKELKDATNKALRGLSDLLAQKGSHRGIANIAETELRLISAVAWVLYALELARDKLIN